MLRVFLIFIIFSNIIINQTLASKDIFKIDQHDKVFGYENAPVTIYEYSSLTCIHCASFHKDVFVHLKKNYIDKKIVKWVRRDFISDKAALKAAKLLQCVPTTQYETFLKIMMDTQQKWAYSKDFDDKLENLVKIADANNYKYKQCIQNQKLEEALIAKTYAIKGMTEGTPAFFVNGKIERKLYSYKSFEEIIKKNISKN